MKTTTLMSLLAVLCTTAHAQDPVKTSPQYYKVLLENDQVHSHPAGVVYVLRGAKLKFTYPDGRTEERAAATGETIWRDPTTHAVDNIGDTEPMPSLSISNLLDRTSPPDYMTTDHKLPTSGPLTSVLQPSRKATAWPADP